MGDDDQEDRFFWRGPCAVNSENTAFTYEFSNKLPYPPEQCWLVCKNMKTEESLVVGCVRTTEGIKFYALFDIWDVVVLCVNKVGFLDSAIW
jgi:hypothetical protein